MALKKKKLISQDIQNIITPFSFANVDPLTLGLNTTRLIGSKDTPNSTILSERTKLMAEFTKISDIYNLKGYNEANKYLNKINNDGYKIDKSLSNSEAVVFYKDNRAVVAFRGTEPSQKIKSGIGRGLPEPVIWANILLGNESIYDQFKDSEKVVAKALQRGYNVENTTGYSMGGTKSIQVGDKFNIESITFNPFLGKTILQGNAKNPNLIHQVNRNTGDIASTGLAIFKPKIKLEIKSYAGNVNIKPVINISKNSTINELVSLVLQAQSHTLDNFTEEMTPLNTELQSERAMISNQKWGEVDIQLKINEAIDANKTYSEYLTEFNAGSADSVLLPNGEYELVGNRVGRGTTQYELWNETARARGRPAFTQAEQEHINSLPIPEDVALRTQRLTPQERASIQKAPTGEYENIQSRYTNEMIKANEPIIENIRGGNNIGSQLIRNITNIPRIGVGVAGSLLGGVVANQALNAVGVDLSTLQPEVASMIQGGAGGVATEVILARVLGASLVPTSFNLLKGGISGVIGGVAQEATSRALTLLLSQTGMSEDAVNITSQSIGGAVGGAITIATIPITASITSSFLGAVAEMAGIEAFTTSVEIGSTGGLVGIGIGAVIGVVIAGSFAISQAFQPKNDYLLAPDRQSRADKAIGQDPRVIAILTDFNEKADFSPEAIQTAESLIKEVSFAMENEGKIMKDYNFQVNLIAVPRGAFSNQEIPNAIIPAYYEANAINTGIYTRAELLAEEIAYNENERTRLERTGTRPTKLYIQNLNQDEKDILQQLSDEGIDISQFTPENISTILGYENQARTYEHILTPAEQEMANSQYNLAFGITAHLPVVYSEK